MIMGKKVSLIVSLFLKTYDFYLPVFYLPMTFLHQYLIFHLLLYYLFQNSVSYNLLQSIVIQPLSIFRDHICPYPFEFDLTSPSILLWDLHCCLLHLYFLCCQLRDSIIAETNAKKNKNKNNSHHLVSGNNVLVTLLSPVESDFLLLINQYIFIVPILWIEQNFVKESFVLWTDPSHISCYSGKCCADMLTSQSDEQVLS